MLQVANKEGIRINAEELIEFYEEFGCDTKLLSEKKKNMSMKKFRRYFEKEAEQYGTNMVKDWVDYISWCKELGYNLKDDYYYMPKNFRTAHNNVMNEYTALQDRRRAEQQKIEAENAKKQMEATMVALQKILPEGMYKSGKKFAILIPHNADEIKEEGKSLHHCVGTYISRVAAGKTTILFVRKQEDLQTPYFTMEYKDGHIEQCRGSHNCDMPKDLQVFTVAFEKKMQEAALNNR